MAPAGVETARRRPLSAPTVVERRGVAEHRESRRRGVDSRILEALNDSEGEDSDLESGGSVEASAVISRVNVGVVSIDQLRRGEARDVRVEQINLFGNAIATMDGLHAFSSLRELCLSNNHLEEVSFHALDPLKQLRVLDLSANRLVSLRGLPLLPRLEELSVAHNRISGFEGLLRPVKLPKLRYLDARGNEIASPVEVVPLQHLRRLSVLRLQSKDGAFANPICELEDYPDSVLEMLPSLKMLDEEDAGLLREVSRVQMPKYDSLLKRAKAMQVKSPRHEKLDAVTAAHRSYNTSSQLHREMRVFVQADEQMGYEIRQVAEPALLKTDVDVPMEPHQQPQLEVHEPPSAPQSVQRIVLREVATNTEFDFDKAIFERESQIVEKQATLLAQQKLFLTKEAEFFAREKELLEQIRQLQGQLTAALERTATTDEEVAKQKLIIEKLRSQCESISTAEKQQEDTLMSEIRRLQDENNQRARLNEELSIRITQKDGELQRIQDEYRQKHSDEAARLEDARKEIDALSALVKETEHRSKQYEQNLATLRADGSLASDKVVRQLSETREQLADALKRNETLEKQFQDLKISRDQYREDCLNKDDEIYRLKKALLQKAEELQESKVQIMKASERQDRIQEQQQQLYERQLQASMMQLEMEFRREHQQATEKLQVTHRKYQESVKQSMRLKATYESCLKRESLLKEEVQRLAAIIEGDKQKLVDQELAKRAEYEFKIQRLHDEKQALQDELEVVRQKRQKASVLQNQLEKQREECERLADETKRLQDVIKEWEAKENDWKAALKVKDVMLDDQVRQLEDLRKQNRKLEDEYQQDTDELQSQIEDLEEALDDNLQKLSDLQEKYDELKHKAAAQDEEALKQAEKLDDLMKQVDLKNAALELIEGEMDRMRLMLDNQDELFQKRLQKHLDLHLEEMERINAAREETESKLRDQFEQERTEILQKYEALANDLKDMATQNTKLRVAVDHERKKNAESDREMRVLLSQLDRERQLKNERLKDIKRLFEQLQQETP